MEPGLSANVSSPSLVPSVGSGSKESSPFKVSLREELNLWVGRASKKDDRFFQYSIPSELVGIRPLRHEGELTMIEGHPEASGSRDLARLPFEPKENHCGIWKDAPNRECHASIGDQGTTASVSCYGNLTQMSQFLGVGHSGVFSIDHKLTEEPYFISNRADTLNMLGSGHGSLSFGVSLPEECRPTHAPEVRWVNWRWPRYECKCQSKLIEF